MLKSKPVVLLVGPFPPPIGGVAAINELIAASLNNSSFKLRRLNTAGFKDQLQIKKSTGWLNLSLQLMQLLRFVFLLGRHSVAIVHIALSSYHSFFKSALFLILARSTRRQVILHLHGGAFDRFYRQRAPLLQKLIRWTFRQSQVVVTLSHYWQNFVRQDLQVTPEKCVILYNCYGLDFSQLPTAWSDFQAARTQPPWQILFIGGLNTKKGVLDLVQIGAQLQQQGIDFEINILGGEQEPGFLTQLQAAIQRQDLAARIHLVGIATGETKRAYFQRSHLLVFPSYVENFPVVVLEAMRAGLPIVATPVGAIPELVQEGENGFLVTPGAIDLFVEKIVYLMSHPEIAQTIGAANLELAQRDFNPRDYGARLTRIYDALF
ncbi:glycosyltransferase family 4 protein [candidate division KSB1 bacterium]|nr:glycosyltransferase family 4 protein [candidate division KSB1 bacterium]